MSQLPQPLHSRSLPLASEAIRMGLYPERQGASRIQVFVVVLALWGKLDLFVSGFRILEDFAFVIPDDDLLAIVIKNVTGIDRHFAPASRRIDDELRHGITGGVTTQALDDLNAFRDRSTEMR